MLWKWWELRILSTSRIWLHGVVGLIEIRVNESYWALENWEYSWEGSWKYSREYEFFWRAGLDLFHFISFLSSSFSYFLSSTLFFSLLASREATSSTLRFWILISNVMWAIAREMNRRRESNLVLKVIRLRALLWVDKTSCICGGENVRIVSCGGSVRSWETEFSSPLPRPNSEATAERQVISCFLFLLASSLVVFVGFCVSTFASPAFLPAHAVIELCQLNFCALSCLSRPNQFENDEIASSR